MGKAAAEFLVGAAVILTPQYQVPLLLGSAALKFGHSILVQKKAEEEEQQVQLKTRSQCRNRTLYFTGRHCHSSKRVLSRKTVIMEYFQSKIEQEKGYHGELFHPKLSLICYEGGLDPYG